MSISSRTNRRRLCLRILSWPSAPCGATPKAPTDGVRRSRTSPTAVLGSGDSATSKESSCRAYTKATFWHAVNIVQSLHKATYTLSAVQKLPSQLHEAATDTIINCR
eukprot:scaffold657392_cov57-Prasinocladus_malaysianus.AAC.1